VREEGLKDTGPEGLTLMEPLDSVAQTAQEVGLGDGLEDAGPEGLAPMVELLDSAGQYKLY
jgi:hypothetical protein